MLFRRRVQYICSIHIEEIIVEQDQTISSLEIIIFIMTIVFNIIDCALQFQDLRILDSIHINSCRLVLNYSQLVIRVINILDNA